MLYCKMLQKYCAVRYPDAKKDLHEVSLFMSLRLFMKLGIIHLELLGN